MGPRDKTNTKAKPKPKTKPAKAAEDDGFVCMYRPTHSHGLMAGVDAGDPDALYELGRLYFEGREGAHYTSRSGEGGKHVVASYIPGVTRNPAAAERLLQQAADKGHEEARKLLAVVRLNTKTGVH